MCFARAEEGEQCQAGDSGVSLGAGAAATWIATIVPEDAARFASCAVGVSIPAAIAALCRSEPVEGGGDGGLGVRRRAKRLSRLQSISRHAGLQRLRNLLAVA